jgi:DHA1 family bicyclomycin/chloramphenicol resistance-like MFS transporter
LAKGRRGTVVQTVPVKLMVSRLIATESITTRKVRYLEVIILMGVLQAFAPLSIDMYLPSLPELTRTFHTTEAGVQFTLVTFFVGFAFGQSLYGPITDRFGRKPPLYGSLVLFVVSSMACAVTPSIGWMSVFRLFQAVGACGGGVMSRAMVRDLFPPEELRKIFSMLVLVLGVSPLIAPLIGSYLLEWFGWRSTFYAQALLGSLCLLGVHFRLPESLRAEDQQPLDWGAIKSNYRRLVSDRTFVGASLVCGFSSAGMLAYIASAPFVFMEIYKVPLRVFPWMFASIAAGMITASQINGRMPRRIPVWKVLRVANLVQLTSGILVLAAALSGWGGLTAIFVPVFAYVSAAGFVFPNGSAIAMQRHGSIAGTASALLGTNQFFVAAITTTILGFIVSTTALPMAVVIAGCALCGNILNFLTLGKRLETGPAH